jgi:hypothetical protein
LPTRFGVVWGDAADSPVVRSAGSKNQAAGGVYKF